MRSLPWTCKERFLLDFDLFRNFSHLTNKWLCNIIIVQLANIWLLSEIITLDFDIIMNFSLLTNERFFTHIVLQIANICLLSEKIIPLWNVFEGIWSTNLKFWNRTLFWVCNFVALWPVSPAINTSSIRWYMVFPSLIYILWNLCLRWIILGKVWSLTILTQVLWKVELTPFDVRGEGIVLFFLLCSI